MEVLVLEELRFDSESRREFMSKFCTDIFIVAADFVTKKYFQWRTGVSIPVPLECESSALPFELVPLGVMGKIETRCIDCRNESKFGVSTEVELD